MTVDLHACLDSIGSRASIVGMLEIDHARAARSHSERLAIIRAIITAPQHEPETDWLEWKSELDVSSAEGAFKAARSILGFGNRDPDYVARYARGCTYLVVGAEPGSLVGVTPHDPADVEQWISPYIARGEPQWSVDYLDLDGTTVMFITIEAPEWGDPIFTLQKGGTKTMSGAIYVRGNGKTEQASPQEVRRLSERTRRSDERLTVGVEWHRPPTLVALADTSEQEMAFLRGEQVRLERFTLRSNPLISSLDRERRTEEEYDAECEGYLRQAATRHRLAIEQKLIETGLTRVALRVCNPTDLNFPKTQVVVRLPGDTHAYFSLDDVEELFQSSQPTMTFMADKSRRGWRIVRDLRSMPRIYLVPIVLALAFPGVVALDGGGVGAVVVWWPLAALGALSLADKPRGTRILLTVLMSVVCLILAIAWAGGQFMLPALFALFVIDVVRATLHNWHRKARNASP